MRYMAVALLTALCLSIVSGCSNNDTPPDTTIVNNSEAGMPYDIEVVAKGLNVPWEIAFSDEKTIISQSGRAIYV